EKAPGQRECDDSIEVLNGCIREVDQASLAAISQQLTPREDISMEALHEQMAASVHEISNLIDPVGVAARSEASQLGHKGVSDDAVQGDGGWRKPQGGSHAGGPGGVGADDEGGGGRPGATLAEAASAAGAVGGMVDSITDSINKMQDSPDMEPEGTFVDYQTTMVKTGPKAIAVTVLTTNPDDLGGLANHLTNEFGNLADEAKYAAVTAENDEIGSHIKKQVGELGFSCTGLVTKAGALQCSPNDSFTKKELIESARKVSEKACITAASAVSGIHRRPRHHHHVRHRRNADRENAETFADHREYILKTAKALVEDTKLLVSGAGASQERLAQAAQSSVFTITKLADVVKLGAASLGSEDPETQVVLINAVKDVAKALGYLISSTKGASGKSHDDPSMLQLKNSAKVMVTNVTSLLKTVKAVEDEATKGTRALEATIEHIKQELAVFSSSEPPPKTTTPEEFIRTTKGITMATAKAVAAGNSCRQEDIIATANLSRRAIADMLHSCKQAAYHPEVSKDVQTRALRYGNECASGYLGLLEHVLVVRHLYPRT
ncbi:hypothetical protein KUCAC02_008568, partial [Chaenocephalus aceratus]